MLADWSSIWTGYAIVWGAMLLFGISIHLRLRRVESTKASRDRTADE